MLSPVPCGPGLTTEKVVPYCLGESDNRRLASYPTRLSTAEKKSPPSLIDNLVLYAAVDVSGRPMIRRLAMRDILVHHNPDKLRFFLRPENNL